MATVSAEFKIRMAAFTLPSSNFADTAWDKVDAVDSVLWRCGISLNFAASSTADETVKPVIRFFIHVDMLCRFPARLGI